MSTGTDSVPSLLLEGEEEDEVISSAPHEYRDPRDMNDQLDAFRQQWRSELRLRRGGRHEEAQQEVEAQARALFIMGTKLEQDGALYEAVSYYRRAMQLVPDIEAKIEYPRGTRDRQESESSVDSFDGEELDSDLVSRFHNLQLEDNKLCSPGYQQRACHISVLPYEVIIYILKWVITSELDMTSLEKVAQVCRGFYLCARDEELWRLSCYRVWGKTSGKVKKYGCWRNMFIERPHLQFVGCYISKMTYDREGERSLDNFYRSWHTINYFRYIRFFCTGEMLMMTSPEDPSVSLQKMRDKQQKVSGMLKGSYRVSGSKVTGTLRRETVPETTSIPRYKRLKNQNIQMELQQSYHVEFEIQHHKKRNGHKLVWLNYSVRNFNRSTGDTTVNEFDLNNKSFPSLVFSRVKSFSIAVDTPLQADD